MILKMDLGKQISSISIQHQHGLDCVCTHFGVHLAEQPHEEIPQCEKGRLELKATVNSGAQWPRRGPRGIGEVYQCWWCLAVTEPDWQLLSVCSLSVISSSHVPTLCTYRAPTTWLYAGHLYIVWITDSSGMCVCVWKEYDNIPFKGNSVHVGIWLNCRE